MWGNTKKVLGWKDIEHMNMLELIKEHVPVTSSVFIQLAKDSKERELRVEAVRRYRNWEGCVFYANGVVGTRHFEVYRYEHHF